MQEIRIVSIENKESAKGMLLVKNIDVKGKKQIDDFKYIETIQFTLVPCSQTGCVRPQDRDNNVVIVFEIETGFTCFDYFVEEYIRKGLKDFTIYNLRTAIKAFLYRQFYSQRR